MLDQTEKAYFESLVWKKINPIRERHFAELENINATPQAGRSPARYTHQIRKFKKELAEARIQAFIETYQMLGRYPNEIDFDDFATELFKVVDNKGDNLPRHLKRGLSPYPPQLVEKIEEQLSNELRQDAAISLDSLRHFIQEGKLVAARQAAFETQMNSSITNDRFKDFQEYLGKQVTALSDLEWEATHNFLDRIPTNLEKVDFLKQLSRIPNDGVKDNSVINPVVHNRNQASFLSPLNKECQRLLSQHFNLEDVLQQAEQITDHAQALTFLWKVLRDYTKYHPTIRAERYQPEERVFCKTIEQEIQFRKDLQDTIAKGNTYNLHGEHSRVNIGSRDNSTNISHKTSENIFVDMRREIQSRVQNDQERTQILNKLDELEEAKGTVAFTQRYQEFIALTADHITILTPFIPALTRLLSS